MTDTMPYRSPRDRFLASLSTPEGRAQTALLAASGIDTKAAVEIADIEGQRYAERRPDVPVRELDLDRRWASAVKAALEQPLTAAKVRELPVLGPIGNRSANRFLAAIATTDMPGAKQIVVIDSGGGDVAAAGRMAQAITAARAKGTRTDAHIIGECASAATLVMAACGTVTADPAARLMVHDAVCECAAGYVCGCGTAAERADRDRLNALVADTYTQRAGDIEPGYWRRLMAAETAFTAHEAVAAGLVNGVLELGLSDLPITWMQRHQAAS